jgi:hypothetical protein
LSDDRFDQLTKAAASTTSRRNALKLLGGGLAAALLGGGLFGGRAQAAGNGCLEDGSPCKVNGDCCNERFDERVHSCCCRFGKQPDFGPGSGFCTPREYCEFIGGVCHQI